MTQINSTFCKQLNELVENFQNVSEDFANILDSVEKAPEGNDKSEAKKVASEKYPEAIKKIQPCLDDIHYSILDCVTSGEYLTSEFDKNFRNFVNHLQVLYIQSSDIAQFGSEEDIVFSEEKAFITLINHRIDYLKSWIMNDPEAQFIDVSRISNDKFSDRSKLVLWNGVSLEFLDFEITLKKNPNKVISDLSEIIKTFQGKKEKFSLQIEKTLFLMNKIDIFKRIKAKDGTEIIINAEKFVLKAYLKKHPPSDSISSLVELLEIYDKEGLDDTQIKTIEKYLQKLPKESSLSYYLKIKVLKDSVKENKNFELFSSNLKEMEGLIESYSVTDDKEHYDFEADRINKIFIVNNYFSYADDWVKESVRFGKEIELGNLIKVISNLKDIVLKIEKECSRIDNYFTYYKLGCLYLSISRYFLSIESSKDLKLADEFHSKSLECQKRLEEKFYMINRFHRYRLRLTETILGEEKKIFIYSSVNLPLYFFEQEQRNSKLRNYSFDISVKIQAEKSNQRLTNLRDQYKDEFKNDLAKEVQGINDIKEEVKKNLFRSTEILSVFAAIVLFTSGSIQLFDNVTDLKSAVILMSLFAFFITSSFLIVTVYTSDKPKERFKNIFKILTVLVISYVVLVIVAWFANVPMLNKSLEQRIVEDYIKKSNVSTKLELTEYSEKLVEEYKKDLKFELDREIRKIKRNNKKEDFQNNKEPLANTKK